MTILAPDKQSYVFSASLACIVGDANAASILSKIHHWIEHGAGRIFDDARWIYNSYKDFVNEFPWLTVARVRKLIDGMRSLGVLKAEALTRNRDDVHCNWYTIDYSVIEELLLQNRPAKQKRRKGTTPVESGIPPAKFSNTPVESDTSSIYTNNSSNKTPIENNSTNAAAEPLKEEINGWEEKEISTSASGIPSQDKTSQIEQVDDSREDNNASSARYHNNIVNLQLFGITLNKQLEVLATKYSEKEIERSLEYMEERIESGKTISNRAGWLTDCLKDEWWRQSSKSIEEAAILEGLSEMGYKLNNPDSFFDEMWLMISEGCVDPMPTNQWNIDGLVGSYLQIMNGITYVNWSDWSWQKKLNQNIFQTMPLTEAKKRFYEER